MRTAGPELALLPTVNMSDQRELLNLTNRTDKTSGFIHRDRVDFTLKSSYCTLASFICEYGSVIWYPYIMKLN